MEKLRINQSMHIIFSAVQQSKHAFQARCFIDYVVISILAYVIARDARLNKTD